MKCSCKMCLSKSWPAFSKSSLDNWQMKQRFSAWSSRVFLSSLRSRRVENDGKQVVGTCEGIDNEEKEQLVKFNEQIEKLGKSQEEMMQIMKMLLNNSKPQNKK